MLPTPHSSVLENNISFVIFTGLNENGSCAAFRQQNSVNYRLLFASASWFVNKSLTTCAQINQRACSQLDFVVCYFWFFYMKAHKSLNRESLLV